MLRDAWSFVLELCDGLRDIFDHGDVDSSSCVIPVNVHAKVLLAIPGGKVFIMFTMNVLDAKIVHA